MEQRILATDISLCQRENYESLLRSHKYCKAYLDVLDVVLTFDEEVYEVDDIDECLTHLSSQLSTEHNLKEANEIHTQNLEKLIESRIEEYCFKLLQAKNIPNRLAVIFTQLHQRRSELLSRICEEYEEWSGIYTKASSATTPYVKTFKQLSKLYASTVQPYLEKWYEFTHFFIKNDCNGLGAILHTNLAVDEYQKQLIVSKNRLDETYVAMLLTAIGPIKADVFNRGHAFLERKADKLIKSLPCFLFLADAYTRLDKHQTYLRDAEQLLKVDSGQATYSTESKVLFVRSLTKMLGCFSSWEQRYKDTKDWEKLLNCLPSCVEKANQIIQEQVLEPQVIAAFREQYEARVRCYTDACVMLSREASLREIIHLLKLYQASKYFLSPKEAEEHLKSLLKRAFLHFNSICKLYDPSYQLQEKDELHNLLHTLISTHENIMPPKEWFDFERQLRYGKSSLKVNFLHSSKKAPKTLRQELGWQSFHKIYLQRGLNR